MIVIPVFMALALPLISIIIVRADFNKWVQSTTEKQLEAQGMSSLASDPEIRMKILNQKIGMK